MPDPRPKLVRSSRVTFVRESLPGRGAAVDRSMSRGCRIPAQGQESVVRDRIMFRLV